MAAPQKRTSKVNTLYHTEADNLKVAVEFLRNIAAGGLVAVAAISPGGGSPEGATFNTGSEQNALTAWLSARSGDTNLYYTLNEPKPTSEQVGRNGRITEADVTRIRGIVVDLDPDEAEEAREGGYERERSRLLGIPEDWKAHAIATPTAAVDSGNGAQIIWLFSEPLPNDEATRRTVKAQAKAVEALFGSDPVHSVDHLFRIPGTINVPTAGKLKKGRTHRPVRLLYFNSGTTCDLRTLSIVASPGKLDEPVSHVSLDSLNYAEVLEVVETGEVPAHLAHVHKLLSPLSERESADRSGRDFALACACIEHGITDPTEIAQVTFSLSPQKLIDRDDNNQGEDYAARTVASALKVAKARPRPEEWFTFLPEPSAVATTRGLRVVSGLVDAKCIPVRDWLVEPRMPIGDVTLCVGEPGISKSTIALRDALAVVTGREDLLRGRHLSGQPIAAERLHRGGSVIVYNAEDRLDEMERRLAVAQRYYGVTAEDMKHPIILWSGVEHGALKIMHRCARWGALERAPGADRLEDAIRVHRPVLVVLDTLVSLSTGAEENDNSDQEVILHEITQLAARHKVNITVLHHTSKTGRNAAGDMGAARGAFAIVGKVRSAYTLVRVTGDGPDEKAWGVTEDDRFIRLDYAKVSHSSAPTDPIVFRRVSAPVGNGTGDRQVAPGEMFGSTPREELEIRGDCAPVLEIVDFKARIVEAAASKATTKKPPATAVQVATFVDEEMGEREEVALSALWMPVGDRLREAKLSKAKTDRAIRPFILDALTGGPVVDHGVHKFQLQAVQDGEGPTAPWLIQRTRLPTTQGDG